ncbi:DUF742 domain-containing protein [Amycolatopsis taiwanensis]|uniref:DUF742 domain-containing protein n=1 Tax=Amycolatopsis taiwanensis TaxID=342230 RepID=UPI000481FF15|nr:DUF742 domain-containing protein [Amycolatopsis taiwanensis]
MRDKSSMGPDSASVDPWEALHQGMDREGIDSPSKFVLNSSAVMLPVRMPGPGRYGPARQASTPMPPDVPPAEPVPPRPVFGTGSVAPAGSAASRHAAPAAASGTGRRRMLMRPYARTRGRTRPDYELALEALVSTSAQGRRYEGAVSAQHRRICDLCCVATRSIAEIAAYLTLPLNVVKVLVSDMDSLGLVMIHQPGLSFGDRSSREFMARVLKGLRSM